jgi:hypothetical protein
MCECTLLVEKKTGKPIEIADAPHKFVYSRYGEEFVLLEDIKMDGIIDYAAAHEIKNSHGVKRGYMFIIGEQLHA